MTRLSKNPWWAQRGARNRLPWVVLSVALLASIAAVWLFYRGTTDRDEARFRNAVQSTTDRIQARLDAYTAVLVSTSALFVADHFNVDADTFRRFIAEQHLETRYPGVQGIGYTRRFAASQAAEIERARQRDGISEFKVWPEDPRAELHSILFLEPLDRRNRAALGYDMHTDPTRREAMDRARDTGAPAASGAVTLVQEIDAHKQRGFLLYVPLYEDGTTPATVEERRAKLLGFIYAPFRIEDLLSGIFGSEKQHRVTFSIRDALTSMTMHVPQDAEQGSRFVSEARLDVAGHPWQLRFESLPALEEVSARRLLPYIIGAALLVVLLLFVLSNLQARAQEQYRLHSRILDSMAEGVSVSDERGIILYTNPAADAMFGYARGALIGQPVSVIGEKFQRGWSGELANLKKDGTPFTTFARISALELAGASYAVCVQEDVTLRKAAENDRDAALAREQTLRLAAEKASRAKDEFVAMVSHELRNPLAPIAAAVDLLRFRGGESIAREVDVIRRQLHQLRSVVEDLLDVSSLTRGEVQLTKTSVQLYDIVRDGLERVDADLRGRRVTVDVPPAGLTVDADRERIAQVVGNVLANAAKYTPDEGSIRIFAENNAGTISLHVADNGTGMSRDVLDTLFEPFVQGDRRLVLAKGGLGLGLTIVKLLVELHGGAVRATSEGSGFGSEFIIELPASAHDVPAATTVTVDKRTKRVLVVDDNADAADLLGELIARAGYEVSVAYTPERALELAQQQPPDAAILDIGLPDMDGYELAAKLQSPQRPLLIAVTGYGREGDRERSRRASFSHHFVKPVSPKRILEALAELR